ncbi:MAG: FlgO family outer membrane protein [Magnetococcus sp. DMHC-6]
MKTALSRYKLATFFLAAALAGGCVPPQSYNGEGQNAAASEMAEVDLIRMSHALTDAMVAELMKNHPSFHRRKPILVTSFVNRNSLDHSSALGLLIADHVASRLTQQGFTIVEPKLRNNLSIRKDEGEFILSRDIDKLSKENRAYAVIVGNYTEQRNILDLTTRMIQISTREVIASVDAKVPLGDNTRDLLIQVGGNSALKVVDR